MSTERSQPMTESQRSPGTRSGEVSAHDPGPYSLGIDLGTGGLKAVLTDAEGTVRASSTRTYQIVSDSPGAAEIDPSAWENAARFAVADLLAQVPDARIVCVGLDGQMHGLVVTDEVGTPLRPAMLWPDSRATHELDGWRSIDPDTRARLANPLGPGMTGPMLAWLATHEATTYARVAHVLSPKDWLRSRLVRGSFGTDPSDASATLLWDVVGGDWDREVCAAVGLANAPLPSVSDSRSLAGETDERAVAWGLPAGTPVAVGCSDVAATLLGVDPRDGQLVLIVGSGAQVLHPRVSPAPDLSPRYNVFRAADDSTYAMAAPLNAGLALNWATSVLSADWAELYGALEGPTRSGSPRSTGPGDTTPPSRSRAIFLPYLAGERVPEPIANASGAFIGLGLDTRRTDLLAAVLEGVAMSIRRAADALPPTAGHEMAVVGGAARHPAFLQLLADVLDRPLRPLPAVHVTAAGAARLGWLAATGSSPPPSHGDTTVVHPRDTPKYEARYVEFMERSRLAAASPQRRAPSQRKNRQNNSSQRSTTDRSGVTRTERKTERGYQRSTAGAVRTPWSLPDRDR
jgi:xylulokinase